MIKKEFLLATAIQYQADRRWELRKVSILGLFVGPMLNSPKEHDKDFIVDNKENYQRDLEG